MQIARKKPLMSAVPLASVWFLIAAFTTLFQQVAQAEQVYRWEDTNGRLHYGSKPPASTSGGASGVSVIKQPPVSRYSTAKLLKGYATLSRPNAALNPKTETVERRAKSPEVRLEQGQLMVKHDDQRRITECSVTVKNTGSMAAHRVIVSFAFEDGKQIPGRGPEGIEPQGQALFAAAPEDLPLAVDSHTADRETETVPPMPLVLIEHG